MPIDQRDHVILLHGIWMRGIAMLPLARRLRAAGFSVEAIDYPSVVGDAVGQDEVYVGRLRAGLDDVAELNLWIASDNVRKGSALNAVQIAELLIKHYL